MDWSQEKKLSKKEHFARVDRKEERTTLTEHIGKENTQKNMSYQCWPTQYAEKNEGHWYSTQVYALPSQK